MPQGVHFTPEIKQIFFRVIHFIESEKNGPQIPMNNSTARIMAMLGISESSLINLKKEMKTIRETREAEEREEEEKRSRLRSSSQNQPTNVSHKKKTVSTWPVRSEMKRPPPKGVPKVIGRPSVILSEAADDEIRFQFHLLLAEKIYPTVSILIERLLATHSDFPIRSETSLRRHMHRLGFSYRKTSKVKLALDGITFVAQRASYFRKLTDLRQSGALIMYHDESWVNVGEEKRSIWIDDSGRGRIRKGDGKGKTTGAFVNILYITIYI